MQKMYVKAMSNQLILGDNLEILKKLPSESVDLIYIDPPFFSNRNYEVIWGDEGEVRSFKDRWSGGMDHYIGWLKERVEEMHRILKPTGSMYLHCDWHADAYIRVGIMDKVFGMGNFRNEIVWKYTTRVSSKKYWNKRHDSIFFYTKSQDYTFNWQEIKMPLSPNTIKKYKLKDENGFYRLNGRGITGSPIKSAKDVAAEWEKTHPHLVVRDYLKDGQPPEDIIEIDIVNQNSHERIGYPTQKPEALLERIIKASSNEGDVVLDCFVGGGTTIAVADRLSRKWIGIDQSVQAIRVSEARINNQQIRMGQRADEKASQSAIIFDTKPFSVKLHKYDYDTIRYSDAFEFEEWIVEQFGGTPNAKQRGDMGLDGKKDGAPIQVKRSDGIGRNVVDNFAAASKRFYGGAYQSRLGDKITDGYIIAFSFGKGAIEEVARLKNEEGLIIELVKVEDIIPIAKKPHLELSFEDLGLDSKELRRIKFTASSQDKAKIQMYQWNFNFDEKNGFKADIMRDLTGEVEFEFTSGEYEIACQVTDNEGICATEIIKLHINGSVRRI